jgi:hypothetical protein
MLWGEILDLTGWAHWSRAGMLLSALVLACVGHVAAAQGFTAASAGGPATIGDRALQAANLAFSAGSTESNLPAIEVDTTEVRTEEPAVPGAKMILTVESGAGEGARYRWVQIAGPLVAIDDPSKPSIQVVLPGGIEKLEFLVIAARREAVRVVRVIVPLQDSATRASWGAQPSGKVRADAGDDQLGLVGRRVTLNGSGSIPADGKNARWLQVGGPPIAAPQQAGSFFSFVPRSPGLYRFFLIVAGDSEVSEPDEVKVLVGTPPAEVGAAAALTGQVPALAAPAPPPVQTPDQILAAALPKLPNGQHVASEVADVMDAISERAGLYDSFAVLQQELARRLERVVPTDAADRAAWNQEVFSPLTAYTISELLGAGMDVRRPQGLQQPLAAGQQERLREHFQKLARAFRAAGVSR